eukprot:GHVO01010108.1.p1 GENE.GHVO01010108.1~~GHVO01010108.1.p1  ORF type:complete len:155 (-),score=29.28 GHVO01010108.1:113-577(-)
MASTSSRHRQDSSPSPSTIKYGENSTDAFGPVDTHTPQGRPDTNHVERYIPGPVQKVDDVALSLPIFEADWDTVKVPVYALRFIEVPIPTQLLEPTVAEECRKLHKRLETAAANPTPSMGDMEEIAKSAVALDIQNLLGEIDLTKLANRMVEIV